MNYHEDCSCCRNRVTAYTHAMNRGLAHAFRLMVDAQVRTGRPVKKRDLKLTHAQYGNLQKLRYFGLADYLPADDAWFVTPRGLAWNRGEIAILTPAAAMRNEALPDDHLAWATHKGKRRAVRIADVLPEEYKERPAYAAEKTDAA